MSVQGYGLFSGPTDRRMRPVNINYGRNQFTNSVTLAPDYQGIFALSKIDELMQTINRFVK